MRARSNGIELEYESVGDEAAPAVLLIMGLGTQMTRWPRPLVDTLVARGFRVILFDNRDVGLSTRLEEADTPDLPALIAAMVAGTVPPVAYQLTDMADDAVGLLDFLGIERAHLVGASMGGMIAQLVAARHPARTLSLTSVMSSSGNPSLPRASDEALALMAQPRPADDDEQAIVERAARSGAVLGSPGYPVDAAVRRAAALADYRRGYYPAGAARHTAAIVAGGDRRPLLRTISAPTVVIHGLDDPLVRVEAGRDTAANIPDADLIEIPGMGHDVPDALIPLIADAIIAVACRAAERSAVSSDASVG
jgi:pimeloyl-ACP methyl ester carboxylesterase